MPFYEVVAYARNQQQLVAPTFTEMQVIYSTAGVVGGSGDAGGLSWSKELHSDGAITIATLPEVLDNDIALRLLNMKTQPIELGIFRNGVLVQRGPLIAWQVEGETLVLHARGLSYYMRYMILTADVTYNQDEAFIVRDLIDSHQDKDWGHFGLDTTGIVAHFDTRKRVYKASELINVYDEIREMGLDSNGYDMVVDPLTRDVVLYNTQKGTTKPASILDARVIQSPNLSMVVTAGEFGSTAIVSAAIGSGELSTAILTNGTTRNGFGLAYVGRARPGVDTNQELAWAATDTKAKISEAQFTPNKNYFSATGISVDDFDIGDTIVFDYDAGFGRLTFDVRVENMFISVSPGNTENLTLDLTTIPPKGCT